MSFPEDGFTVEDKDGVTVMRFGEEGGRMMATIEFRPTIDRLIEVQRRLGEEGLRKAVIQVLRNEGYTIIEPD